MRRIFVDRESPQRDAIQEAAKWILAGGVVALPTDTLYGLGADPFSSAGVARVFAVKGRATDRALPLIAADVAQVAEHLGRLSPVGERLAARFWPGPLTLLVAAPRGLARDVTGGTRQVAVRVPADAVARAICAAAGRPITATSANLSGKAPASTLDEARAGLGEKVKVYLEGGKLAAAAPSTVVAVKGSEWKMVRMGAISEDQIAAALAGEALK
jgi:L-threonylcarbamoyladenylate synthase